MPTPKTTNLNLRISPDVKEALRVAADKEHRSLSNMMEYLIVQHCKLKSIVIGNKATQG